MRRLECELKRMEMAFPFLLAKSPGPFTDYGKHLKYDTLLNGCRPTKSFFVSIVVTFQHLEV